MFTFRPLRTFAVALVAGALVLAACTSTEPAATTTTTQAITTTTADPDADLVFGDGILPDTVPQSFPIPSQAVVGATMIDRTRSLTEFVLTLPANVDAAVQFFEQNLPALGYEITSSAGSDGKWEMEFSGDGIEGTINLSTGGAGLAFGSISFTAIG